MRTSTFFWVIFTSTSMSQLFKMFGFPKILFNKVPPTQHDLFEEQKKNYLKIGCIKKYGWCEPQYNMHDVPTTCLAMWINALQGMLFMF